MGAVKGGCGRGGSFQKVDGQGHSEKILELRCTKEEAAMQNPKGGDTCDTGFKNRPDRFGCG